MESSVSDSPAPIIRIEVLKPSPEEQRKTEWSPVSDNGEVQVLRLTEKSDVEGIVDDYFKHGRESSDSFLVEPDMPAKKKERRTFIDIKTNDATLFNLGYTARVTQGIPQDQMMRKTSIAHFGPSSMSMIATALQNSQVASGVDTAKDASSFRISETLLLQETRD